MDGAVAVSDNVAVELAKYASNPVERLFGSSRYDTSYKLYQRGGEEWGGTAVVATGANYADALSVSSFAYAGKASVFLCDPNAGLTSKQQAALEEFDRIVVVGGSGAVPDRYVTYLFGGKVKRLVGDSRYGTSKVLAEWVQNESGLGMSMDGVVYATGENFPDASVSGPLAGTNRAPVLLVGAPNTPTVAYSEQFRGQVTKAYVAGGEGAVSDKTMTALANALGLADL